MLFASLFSEACVTNPAELAADLANGGGAGQFGLNKPNACVLTAVQEISSNGLQEEVECTNRFFGPTGLEQVQSLDGLPDNRCVPSAAQEAAELPTTEENKKRCGNNGEKCGREPTADERDNIERAENVATDKYFQVEHGDADYATIRIIDNDQEMLEVCGVPTACTNSETNVMFLSNELVNDAAAGPDAPTEELSPISEELVYDVASVIGHEMNHINNPGLLEKEIKELDMANGNFVPPTGSRNPSPDNPDSDKCSSQAQRINALADCLERTQMNNLLKKEGRKPAPDPVPPGDEVGGSAVPNCGEAQVTGAGGYFGTKKNSADDCLIGDFCDFTQWAGISSRTGFSKKCQFVQSEERKESCPPLQ